MKACGIIAEFDPFHNGHRYLLEQARASGATHIAVVMSGNAVQRGMPAFFDKFARAENAVTNGADIVLELPAPFSCSNAEIFARSGVSALAALGEGVIERLVFGSETEDTGLILSAAEAAESLRSSEAVAELIREGKSSPAAVAEVCRKEYGEDIASVLSNPNSTLAAEYCRALKSIAPRIEPFAVKRKGAAHDSFDISGSFASGSAIREMIAAGKDVTGFMPPISGEYCSYDKTDSIFLYRLITASREELLSLPDMSEAAADRILKTAEGSFTSAEGFLMACKSKNITLARLRRAALHLVLGVRKEDIAPLPYVRILAFNERGRELLAAGEHTLPIDTSLARLEKISPLAGRVSLLERRAAALRGMGTVTKSVQNEYKAKIRLTNS